MNNKKYVKPAAEALNFYLEGEVASFVVGSQGGGDQWSKKREATTTSTSSNIWNNNQND